MRLYSKRELADAQFDRAMDLFLDTKDYLSAITLAGAAEALYGGLFRALAPSEARKHALDSFVDGMQKIGEKFGETVERKDAIATVNSERDALKHFQDGKPVAFDAADAAAQMIDRAMENLFFLTGGHHPRIGEFDAACRELSAERERELDALDCNEAKPP